MSSKLPDTSCKRLAERSRSPKDRTKIHKKGEVSNDIHDEGVKLRDDNSKDGMTSSVRMVWFDPNLPVQQTCTT